MAYDQQTADLVRENERLRVQLKALDVTIARLNKTIGTALDELNRLNEGAARVIQNARSALIQAVREDA